MVLVCSKSIHSFVSFTLMKPCMPGRNISTLLNLIYFENLFRDIGFSSSYCFVPVYLTEYLRSMTETHKDSCEYRSKEFRGGSVQMKKQQGGIISHC